MFDGNKKLINISHFFFEKVYRLPKLCRHDIIYKQKFINFHKKVIEICSEIKIKSYCFHYLITIRNNVLLLKKLQM